MEPQIPKTIMCEVIISFGLGFFAGLTLTCTVFYLIFRRNTPMPKSKLCIHVRKDPLVRPPVTSGWSPAKPAREAVHGIVFQKISEKTWTGLLRTVSRRKDSSPRAPADK